MAHKHIFSQSIYRLWVAFLSVDWFHIWSQALIIQAIFWRQQPIGQKGFSMLESKTENLASLTSSKRVSKGNLPISVASDWCYCPGASKTHTVHFSKSKATAVLDTSRLSFHSRLCWLTMQPVNLVGANPTSTWNSTGLDTCQHLVP